MAKTIHIHLHSTPTRDAGNWEESKHPRAENGQFGKGSGGGTKPAAKKPAFKPNNQTEARIDLGAVKHVLERTHQAVVTTPTGSKTQNKRQATQATQAKTSGVLVNHGIEAYNLYANAGGEKLQIRLTSKEQAEWAQKHLGLKISGEGVGSYDLTEEQAKRFKVGASEKPVAREQSQATLAETMARIRSRKSLPESAETQQIPKHSVRGFIATAEKSQFGGYRPHITHSDNRTAHLSQHAFEKPEQAAEYAKYLAGVPGVVEQGMTPQHHPRTLPGYIDPNKRGAQ